MDKTKCIIIEDTISDMELLAFYINKDPSLHLSQTFTNGVEALSYLKNTEPPLLFLDIDMPEINGMEIFKRLDYSPICIFVTAHSEYALESYEAQAFDFILKPVTQKRFELTVKRLNEYIELKQRADLFETSFEKENIIIKEGNTNYKVLLNEILYVEALKDYSKVVTTGKNYITLSKLKHFVDKLPAQDFLRIHRSYAVAKNKLSSYNKEEVCIDKKILPIGKTYRAEIISRLEK